MNTRIDRLFNLFDYLVVLENSQLDFLVRRIEIDCLADVSGQTEASVEVHKGADLNQINQRIIRRLDFHLLSKSPDFGFLDQNVAM